MDDFYELLGVSESASQDELKQAYRKKVREYHPDVSPKEDSRELFKLLNRAYEVLSDSAERKDYDRLGHVTYVRERMDGYDLADVDDILGTDQSGRRRSDSSSGVRNPSRQPRSGSRGSGSSRTTTRSRNSTRSGSSTTSGKRETTGSATSGSNRSSKRSRSTATSSSAGTTRNSNATSGSHSGSSSSGRSRRTESGSGSGRTEPTTNQTSAKSNGQRANGSGSGLGAAIDSSSVRQSRRADDSRSRTFTLGRAWLSVAVSFVLYIGGLVNYIATNRSDIDALVDAVAASPIEGLLAPLGTEPPLEAAVAGATAAFGGQVSLAAGLLFGAVLLAVTMTLTVKRFGNGSARLYVIAGLSPLVGLAAGLVAQTTLVTLLLLVVLPVGGCLLFFADVGRYLGAQG